MSDMRQLEHDVRRSLKAAADELEIDDRAFDPRRTLEVELDEWPARRPHRVERTLLVVAAVVVVLGVAAIVVRETGGSSRRGDAGDAPTSHVTVPPTESTLPATTPASVGLPSAASLAKLTASVPASVLDAVGAGSSSSTPTAGSGPVLTADGKPRVVWIGAEYCPYCAAERWPLIVALSRFGAFSDLSLMSSASVTPQGVGEVYPNTQTFSFHGSTYSSPYVVFDAVEMEDRKYAPLDTPTADEQSLFSTYDAPPYVSAGAAGSIPFIDFANQYLTAGSTFDLSVLQGKTGEEIASALSHPTSDIAKGVDGSANVITAAICRLTLNRPASVCSDPAIAALGPTGPQRG